MYCDQLIVLGYNSGKYDLPLIKKLPPVEPGEIRRYAALRCEEKRRLLYMAIASPKLKFLDLINYVAAGTSLEKLYKSDNASVPKGTFPYQWFDSLDKLNATSLPSKEEFFSVLTNKTIYDETYQSGVDTWNIMAVRDGDVRCFGDYTRYYNDCDVVGLVHVIEKMISIEKENKLDIFKDSTSLAGYLFQNLDESNDCFVGFGREHKHLYKILRENIVGGPSIIFHRYQERGLTKIKGAHICEKVIGYDANSLYHFCLAQKMPTGYYSLREKKNNFRRYLRYSRESLQWLDHFRNENMTHAENSVHGEVRIGNHSVHGFDVTTNTVYEYYGCYHHGHTACNENHDARRWTKTMAREASLKALGYNIVSITSCEWFAKEESNVWYHPSITTTVIPCSMEDILDAVKSDEIFGFIQCSFHVPPRLVEKFSEFSPIFKNTEISMADIGPHMQSYCRSIGRRTCVKRSLISSMKGETILLLSPLLKKYLEMGFVVTTVEFVIEYNGKRVFEWFMNEVVDDRRMADLNPEYAVRAETSKTKGNSGYGRTLINKFTHTNLTFTKEKNTPIHVASPYFKTMQELSGGVYEIEKQKRKVLLDLPMQIGLAVYSYAKLHLIGFWEFLNAYLMDDHYQLMECDTDSLYIAFAKSNIDDCVKPELREKWLVENWHWFSSEDVETMIPFQDGVISLKQFDKRTPGKFKPEFIGHGQLCLNSKVFHIWNEEEED